MANLDTKPAQSDQAVVRGEGLAIPFTVKRLDGSVYPLAGCALRLYIKASHATPNASAYVTYTTGNGGISVTDPVLGTAQVNRQVADFSDTTQFPGGTPRAYVLWVDPAIEPAAQGNWTVNDL